MSERGFGNYVIKRSTFGLSQRFQGHQGIAVLLKLRRRPGWSYRRSSATNPSSLWGWLGLVMTLRALKELSLISKVSQQGLQIHLGHDSAAVGHSEVSSFWA